MTSHLSELIKNGMSQAGVDRESLIRILGYRNRNKGFRRLDAWLSGDDLPDNREQVEQLATALKLDVVQIAQAIQADIEEMKLKVNEERRRNPNYRVTIRALPGFYVSHELPGSLSVEEALKQAQLLGKGLLRFALNTPENKTYWCNANGEVESETEGKEPFMSIGGKAFRVVVCEKSNHTGVCE